MMGSGNVVVNSYEVGRLTLTVIDPVTDHIVWQSVASEKVNDNMTPDEQRKYISDSVSGMLKHFPPLFKLFLMSSAYRH